jgi:hypothetical protein
MTKQTKTSDSSTLKTKISPIQRYCSICHCLIEGFNDEYYIKKFPVGTKFTCLDCIKSEVKKNGNKK